MNTYEAEYKNAYTGFGISGICDVTAVRKIGQLVDGQWYHSLHWPREIDCKWRDAVMKSLNDEMKLAVDRLNELKLAERILSSIDFKEPEQDD